MYIYINCYHFFHLFYIIALYIIFIYPSSTLFTIQYKQKYIYIYIYIYICICNVYINSHYAQDCQSATEILMIGK